MGDDDQSSQQHMISDEELRYKIPSQHETRRRKYSNGGEGSLDSSSEQDTESNTKDYAPSSTLDDTSSLDSDSDDDDKTSSSENESMSGKILYLQEKQKLLQRVSLHLARDSFYDAFNAFNDASYDVSEDAPIWNESKKFIKESESRLNTDSGYSSDDVASTSKKRTATLISSSHLARSSPNRKSDFSLTKKHKTFDATKAMKLKIDISQVDCIPSKVFEDGINIFSKCKDMICHKEEEGLALAAAVIKTKGAQSLDEGSSTLSFSSNNTDYSTWQAVSDNEICTMGMVSSKDQQYCGGVSLQEAMSITDEPRLVAQSTSPYTVVSANKAFYHHAGLTATSKVVGQPIASVLQVSLDHLLPSAFWVEGGNGAFTYPSNIKSCQLQVKPVIVQEESPTNYHVKNRRSLNIDTSLSSALSRQVTRMSHILVVLRDMMPPQPSHVVLGTVG